MKAAIGFILLAVLGTCCSSQSSELDGTELLFTFLVHRHGDRTPVEASLVFSNNPSELTALSEPYGWGQLTNIGKRRSYELGEFISSRYSELISPQYNLTEVYLRSTDSTRAKMTILTSLAAIYPTGYDSWSNKINWQPVPYTTVPAKYDFNAAFVNCPVLIAATNSLMMSSPETMARFNDVLTVLSDKTGIDITQYPVLAYAVLDVYASQKSLGLPLDPEVEEIYPELQEAADAAIDVLYGNENYIALQAGVLLKEFFTNADQVLAGNSTETVRIYSAHDFNVYSFEAVTQVNRQGVPKYASVLSLELRKVIQTGEYVVVPVYLPSPGEEPVYLTVAGCDQLCAYEDFVSITSKFSLDEDSWREQCGFTNDLIIDTSNL